MAPPEPRVIKAVIFDLDGTLIDTAPDLCGAVNRLLTEEGRRVLALPEATMMIGDGARRLVERAFAATGVAAPESALDALTGRFLGHYEGHDADASRAYPGVEAALAALAGRGLALGVCTNKPQAPSETILAAFGLARYFGAVVGGDAMAGVRKPDPRHLLAVVEALGADVATSVMVGDNENDAAAAHAAGMPMIALAHGYARRPLDQLGAAHVIDGFDRLPAALATLPATLPAGLS